MLSSRWVALIVFSILVGFIVAYDKDTWRQKVRYYGMTFLEGMVGGFIIDIIGVNAGYYYFPRQPFLSWQYFAIVIPCWGVFGLFINCLWRWLGKEQFIRGMAVTLFPLLLYYEGANLLTNSWVYTVPFHIVAIGWIPLIIVFAGCNRRRKVVFKMDKWIRQCEQPKLRLGLQVLRYSLTVLMFPLLIVSIFKVLSDLVAIRNTDITFGKYMRQYLMIEST